MRKSNNIQANASVINGATSKSEIAEYQACALAMQNGTRAEAKKAFEKIYNRYSEWIKYKILNSMKANAETAEDLLQEIFAKVFTKIHTYSPDYALSTWLYRIAVNTIIDHKRNSNVEVFSIESLQTDYASNNDESVGETLFQIKDESADINDAINKTERQSLVQRAISIAIQNEKERAVLMFFMEGLTNEEIQEKTKLPEGTIKALIFRAKGRIKDFLVVESPDLLLMDRFYNKDLRTIN